MSSAFYICSAAYNQVHFRPDLNMEANTMKGAVWSRSILFAIKATQGDKQRSEQTTKVVTGKKGVIYKI